MRIKELADTYGLNLVILFGSQVTGGTHRESDYDVGYAAGHTLTIESQGKLILDLIPCSM